jgi:hypothetical protein
MNDIKLADKLWRRFREHIPLPQVDIRRKPFGRRSLSEINIQPMESYCRREAVSQVNGPYAGLNQCATFLHDWPYPVPVATSAIRASAFGAGMSG